MIITVDQYFNQYVNIPPMTRVSADILMRRVNGMLLDLGFIAAVISSGYRNSLVNDEVGGKKNSTHLTGEGIDLNDPERKIAKAILKKKEILDQYNLYMENPRWTPKHVHLQTRPVPSGNRIYIPDSTPPKTPEINLEE